MSDKPYSAVIAAPADDAPAVNTIFEALGYGPNTLELGASSDGVSKETVLFNHGFVDDEFVSLFAGVKAGKIPALPELKEIDVPGVLSRLNVTITADGIPIARTAELCKRLSVTPLTRSLPEVEATGSRDKIDIDGKIPIPSSIIVDQPIDVGVKR